MDIFQRSQASSVPAFAARAMLGIGKGYAQATADARAFLDAEQPDGVWTLSLLLVLWFGGSLKGAEADAIARLIQTTGAARVLGALSLFREQLLPFVQAAYSADNTAQLAAAGVYFRSALDRIGPGTISSAVKGAAVADIRARLASQVPLPDDVRQMYRAAQADSPIGTAPTANSSATGRAVATVREGRPLPGAKGVAVREKPSGAQPDSAAAPAKPARAPATEPAPAPTTQPASVPARPVPVPEPAPRPARRPLP